MRHCVKGTGKLAQKQKRNNDWKNYTQKIMLQAEKREMLSGEVTLLPLSEVSAWPDRGLIYLMK